MCVHVCLSSRYSIAYSIFFSALVSFFFQVSLWTHQTHPQPVLPRVLQQEISWFNVNETGDLNTRLSEWVTEVDLNQTCKHGGEATCSRQSS